jgi:hypothetical protein
LHHLNQGRKIFPAVDYKNYSDSTRNPEDIGEPYCIQPGQSGDKFMNDQETTTGFMEKELINVRARLYGLDTLENLKKRTLLP